MWNLLCLSCIDLFHIISFVQFKTMLMSLWGDEGIQTAFQRFAKVFLLLVWKFQGQKNFLLLFLIICNCIFCFQYLIFLYFDISIDLFRRNEYQLTDSVQYFLNNVERIAAPDYVPTLQVSLQVSCISVWTNCISWLILRLYFQFAVCAS